MDNSMVKRGIGAVVLAIIAALLLGWLLKDKSQERQELVDIKMPSTSEMNIPSLTDAVNKVGDSAASIVEKTKEKVADTGSSVVAAASGTVESAKNTLTDTTTAVTDTSNNSGKKPGFSIRPPQPNETKEIVDNLDNTANNAPEAMKQSTEKVAYKVDEASDTVIASTKKKENFTPQIVEKKKVVNATKTVAPKKTNNKKKVMPTSSTASSTGKYSIQLLATSSETRAKKLADVMTSEGYHSSITQTHRNGKLLYRVRVGGYSDRNKAINAQEGMKKRYQKNFFVQNSLVVSK